MIACLTSAPSTWGERMSGWMGAYQAQPWLGRVEAAFAAYKTKIWSFLTCFSGAVKTEP